PSGNGSICACYTALLRQFGRNLDATLATARQLAGGSALIRAISLPNGYPGGGNALPAFATAGVGLYQAVTERTMVCGAARKYGGDCIDIVRAFNGSSGTGDAYQAGLMTRTRAVTQAGKPAAHGPVALSSGSRAPPELIARPAFVARHVLPRLGHGST